MERMAQRYRDVDASLAETARDDASLTGMSTTMTLACSLGTQMILAHLGDSRAYLYRADRLVRLTRDHTIAQGLADAGMIDPPGRRPSSPAPRLDTGARHRAAD